MTADLPLPNQASEAQKSGAPNPAKSARASFSLSDPVLQELEATLATSVPQMSQVDQHRLLYECAFAAGRHSTERARRFWQASTIALAVFSMGLGTTFVIRPVEMARQGTLPPPAVVNTWPVDEFPFEKVPRAEVHPFDAWQIPPEENEISRSVVQLDSGDSTVQSLTVRAMSRNLID